jgi:hypothetical protein
MPLSLPVELLQDLAGSYVRTNDAKPNRRAAQRVPLHRQAKVFTIEQLEIGSSMSVALRDLSTDGVGFIAETAFVVGSRFILSVARRSGGEARLLCSVRRCDVDPNAAEGSAFFVGGMFEQILSSTAAVERIRGAILAT